MRARYADGRAAITVDVDCEIDIRTDVLVAKMGETAHEWRYNQIARSDDGNGRIILKRKPDTGERLIFEPESEEMLRLAAPDLFTQQAHGVEQPRIVIGVVAAAWSLAAAFLVGVPMAAGPVASVVPPQYRVPIFPGRRSTLSLSIATTATKRRAFSMKCPTALWKHRTCAAEMKSGSPSSTRRFLTLSRCQTIPSL